MTRIQYVNIFILKINRNTSNYNSKYVNIFILKINRNTSNYNSK